MLDQDVMIIGVRTYSSFFPFKVNQICVVSEHSRGEVYLTDFFLYKVSSAHVGDKRLDLLHL